MSLKLFTVLQVRTAAVTREFESLGCRFHLQSYLLARSEFRFQNTSDLYFLIAELIWWNVKCLNVKFNCHFWNDVCLEINQFHWYCCFQLIFVLHFVVRMWWPHFFIPLLSGVPTIHLVFRRRLDSLENFPSCCFISFVNFVRICQMRFFDISISRLRCCDINWLRRSSNDTVRSWVNLRC